MDNNIIPERTRRSVKELRNDVRFDSYNLTREDHDAIELRID